MSQLQVLHIVWGVLAAFCAAGAIYLRHLIAKGGAA